MQYIGKEVNRGVKFAFRSLQTELGKVFYIIAFAAAGVIGAVVPFDIVLFQKFQKGQRGRIKFAAVVDSAVHIQKNSFDSRKFLCVIHYMLHVSFYKLKNKPHLYSMVRFINYCCVRPTLN